MPNLPRLITVRQRASIPVLVPGDAVVVSTSEGPAVGTVVRVIPAIAERKRPADDSPDKVVRSATREDVVDPAEAPAAGAGGAADLPDEDP